MSTTENRPRASSPLDTSGTAELTPERWQQIKELFAAAQEHNPGERDEFVQKACGRDRALLREVASLLAAAEPESADAGSRAESRRSEDARIGRRVGAYEILRRIGRGGMATVYLAARADQQFEKQVAVKILLPELDRDDLLRRFRNERQTLAKLDHPNIVKLLDGGSTEEGLPYLVMDYVDGLPIDQYCDERKLSTDERLRLFCQVCAAVECAHQNFVIHRDLKPSNILVTPEGIPKLLDFGISKVLHPESKLLTQSATRRMTPAYASPEQVRSEQITPATDIYSLGVVLYELLTGHRPYRLRQNTPAEVERAICEQDPEKPSTAVNRIEADTLPDGTTVSKTPEVISASREGHADKLRRRLRGDLDNIVLTALQKDPQRRYHSVEDLSLDIQRHLQHLPVTARHSTLAYRTSKFARRHTTEMLAASLMVIIIVAAIGFVILEQRQAIERARQELASQRSRGRRSVAVLGFRNLSARPETAWLSTALSEMLTTELSAGGKLRTIPGETVAQTKINLSLPEEDALSPTTLGRIYKNLGSDFVVLGSYLDMGDSDRAIRLDLRVQDAALRETIASLTETGTESNLPGLVNQVGTALRERLGVSSLSPTEAAKVQASLPANPEATRLYAEGLGKLRVFDAMGARVLLEKAVTADSTYALAHSALSDAWGALGYEQKAKREAQQAFDLAGDLPREQSLWVQARYSVVATQWEKAIEIYRTLFNFFPDNLDYGLKLTEAQVSAGQYTDAATTLAMLRKLPPPLGDDPRIDLTELGAAIATSDYKRELAIAQKATRKGELTENRLLVAEALFEQGHAYRSLNEFNKAKDFFTEARRRFDSVGDRYGKGRVSKQLGIMFAEQNDLANAEKAFQEALEIAHDLGNKSGEAAELDNIANVRLLQRNLNAAAGAYERSLVLARQVGDQAQVASSLHNLGLVEYNEGRLTRAKEHFQEAQPLARRYADKDLLAGCLINLAHVHAAQENLATALKLADDSRQTLRGTGAQGRIAALNLEVADLKLLAGDLNAAQKLYEEALQIFLQAGQEFDTSFSLFGLGDILLARDDLLGARKQHEAALSLRRKDHGAVRVLFDSRIRTAQLSLEEGRPYDAESGVREALKEYAAGEEPEARIEADTVLVQALLAQEKLAEAQQVVAGDQERLANTEDRVNLLRLRILKAEVESQAGSFGDAMGSLQACVEESRRSGMGGLHFEARLALGQAEMRLGKLVAGRANLSSLERDAKAKGFLLIARKAATARRHS